MILADVDLQIMHRLGMKFVVGERPGSEGATHSVDDRDRIPLNSETNGTRENGKISARLRIDGPGGLPERRPILEERRVDGAEVDQGVGILFRLGGGT